MSAISGEVSPPLAVTAGEPSGIGLDVTLMAFMRRHALGLPAFFLIGDPSTVVARARRLAIDVPVALIETPGEAAAAFGAGLPILELESRQDEAPGRIRPANARGTIEAIDRAVAFTLSGEAAAMVTNPIDKKALYDAGFRHPGHTEYLAEICAPSAGREILPVMLLTGPQLSCVPLTIHVPLAEVPGLLTRKLIETTCRIVASEFRERFAIARPRLAVAGLNPHAGERGSIGTEDEAIIRPAVDSLREEGIDIVGPLPADTMFHAPARARYDVAVCMYHDQALIPAKTLAFDETVNVTLGLPIIRTSPDHGTAADIAGTGAARPDSFIAALRLADRMVASQRAGKTPHVASPEARSA